MNEIIVEANYLTRSLLSERYKAVREFTELLCKPLHTEDYVVQSMPDASPAKWHISHTSWFFETFVLKEGVKDYKPLNSSYSYLFNSYYIQAGARFTRAHRGLITRPTVKEAYEYRNYVDRRMFGFIEESSEEDFNRLAPVIEIGLHHEQQHQELLLTDIKHLFSINPLKPVYAEHFPSLVQYVPRHKTLPLRGGLIEAGYNGNKFCYDNETPFHKYYIEPFRLGNRLITNGEYINFMEDDGYKRGELWLSDGFASVEKEKWEAPLYWEKIDGDWWYFTLFGFHKVDMNEPVCHVSYFEADAFARWKGMRLPTEYEWETAAAALPIKGNFVENGNFHPAALPETDHNSGLSQIYGDVWEWTMSPYTPYPGYKTLPGALGEYNGKFMSGQMVLRGGSCATSVSHIRKTYRNFFYPASRWQFMGIRLASEEND